MVLRRVIRGLGRYDVPQLSMVHIFQDKPKCSIFKGRQMYDLLVRADNQKHLLDSLAVNVAKTCAQIVTTALMYA